MINAVRLAQKIARSLSLAEWTLVKIDLLVLGLLLAKRFPVLTSLHWARYVGFIVLAEIYFIWKISTLKQ